MSRSKWTPFDEPKGLFDRIMFPSLKRAYERGFDDGYGEGYTEGSVKTLINMGGCTK